MKRTLKLWLGIGIIALLSPLGLIIPAYFKAGPGWGEWSAQEVKGLVGYVPRGMEKLSSLWNAPAAGYSFPGLEQKGLSHQGFAYIISAAAGIAAVIGIVWVLGKFLAKKGD